MPILLIEIGFCVLGVLACIHGYFYTGKDLPRIVVFFSGVLITCGAGEYLCANITESYAYVGWSLYVMKGLPLAIPVGWCGFLYCVVMVSTRMARRWEGKRHYFIVLFLLAGFTGMFFDFMIDPVAGALGWWRWTSGGFHDVPWTNFIGFFIWTGVLVTNYMYFITRSWSNPLKYSAWLASIPVLLILTVKLLFPLVA